MFWLIPAVFVTTKIIEAIMDDEAETQRENVDIALNEFDKMKVIEKDNILSHIKTAQQNCDTQLEISRGKAGAKLSATKKHISNNSKDSLRAVNYSVNQLYKEIASCNRMIKSVSGLERKRLFKIKWEFKKTLSALKHDKQRINNLK